MCVLVDQESPRLVGGTSWADILCDVLSVAIELLLHLF